MHKKRERSAGRGKTAVDLFCGAGGLSLGLEQAGFDLRAAADVWAPAGRTHERNFPNTRFLRNDVRRLSGKDILETAGVARGELDLLTGGPPCQGFSIIGARQPDDPRNGLFKEFMRVAAEVQPRAVMIENVPGLATWQGGNALQEIQQAFSKAGYVGGCAELLAAQYGVPQMRWRLFFIGWHKSAGIKGGGFPPPTHGRGGIGDLVPNRSLADHETEGFLTTHDAIADLPALKAGELVETYAGSPSTPYQEEMRDGLNRELYNHYAPKLSAENLRRLAHLKPGQDWRDLPRTLLPPGMQRALRKDHTRRYSRMTWDGVPRSIITRFRDPKSGEYTHPQQNRTISIREAARIQSFPDRFEFAGGYSHQYDLVGNAVPPRLGSAVAHEIARVLDGKQEGVALPTTRYSLALNARQVRLTTPA